MHSAGLRRGAAIAAVLTALTIACAGTRREVPADHVFRGGAVYTVDPERRVVFQRAP